MMETKNTYHCLFSPSPSLLELFLSSSDSLLSFCFSALLLPVDLLSSLLELFLSLDSLLELSFIFPALRLFVASSSSLLELFLSLDSLLELSFSFPVLRLFVASSPSLLELFLSLDSLDTCFDY